MSTLFSISQTDKNPYFNGYGPEGQGFESLTACQEKAVPIWGLLFSYILLEFEPLTSKREAFFERSGSCGAHFATRNALRGFESLTACQPLFLVSLSPLKKESNGSL